MVGQYLSQGLRHIQTNLTTWKLEKVQENGQKDKTNLFLIEKSMRSLTRSVVLKNSWIGSKKKSPSYRSYTFQRSTIHQTGQFIKGSS